MSLRKIMSRGLPLSLALTGIVASSSVAQRGQSVLELLDTQGRELRVGDRKNDTLSDVDYRSIYETYLEAWELRGDQGTRVTIDMQSGDFDAYLFVVGPGLARPLQDDNSGDGCQARITFTLLDTDPYRVVATTMMAEQTGSYTLVVTEGNPPASRYECGDIDPDFLSALPTENRRLARGVPATGRLTAEDPRREGDIAVQAWALAGEAGESVDVTLESTAFDAMLFVTGPGLSVLSDDDGAGNLNSRLTVRFPADGDYIVAASALGAGSFGEYTITLSEPVDVNALPVAGRVEVFGEAITGMLTEDDPIVIDGRRGQAWELEGVAGESVTLELRSEEFDTYLYVFGPGLTEPLEDDDSAGDLNSRIAITFAETGTYRVIVSGLTASNIGTFELSAIPGLNP